MREDTGGFRMLCDVTWHGYASGGMPESHPPALAGVWAKMRRAKAHQLTLTAATEAYVNLPPYRIIETYTDDRKILRAVATLQPPEDLALILGDLVQNLRSALDHLAWAFARTVRDPPSRRTHFPMFDSPPDDFAGERQVRHIPAPVREIMEAMQPYRTDDEVGQMIGRELAVLRELSNRDKHRVLLLAENLVWPKHVFSNTPEGTDSEVRFDIDRENGQWAEISHPLDRKHGPYTPHFEVEVTIIEPGLPWRSGLDGIAHALYEETSMAIGAFRSQWPLLEAHE